MKYKCCRGFTSATNKQYYYGQKLTEMELRLVPLNEQRNFVQDNEVQECDATKRKPVKLNPKDFPPLEGYF